MWWVRLFALSVAVNGITGKINIGIHFISFQYLRGNLRQLLMSWHKILIRGTLREKACSQVMFTRATAARLLLKTAQSDRQVDLSFQ